MRVVECKNLASVIRMDREEHYINIGRLVGNFQSLEFALRAYFGNLPSARPAGLPPGVDIYNTPVGDELPENEITSFESLRELIKKFNEQMKLTDSKTIDISLVEVRDALTHGRVSSSTEFGIMRLLKFSKPRDEKVRVTFNQEMNLDWFGKEQRRVVSAAKYVLSKMAPKKQINK